MTQTSAAPARRVVITGLGVVNPLGLTLDSFRQALAEGRSGIRPIKIFDASELTTRIAGEVSDFVAKNYVDKEGRKQLKVMARGIQMAVAGAQLAMQDAGLSKGQLNPERFGVVFGSGLLATELEEIAGAAHVSADPQRGVVDLEKWGSEGIPAIPPLWMLKYLPNMLACHVSIMHNAQGPNNTITEGDVASLLSIGEGMRILQRDAADFMLVGGADSRLNPLSMVRQCLFGHLSRRNDTPEKAARPFERWRDGLVIGEGAGVLALEELEHAKRRGANIHAEVVGFASGCDFKRNGQGLARVMRTALQSADITPDDLDHINAHGMSTVPMDIWEARGLREVFGSTSRPIPVFAAKSYFGSLGAASGSAELIASLVSMRQEQIPATLNYEEPDPECPVHVTRQPQKSTRPYVLKLGFTDMGQAAVVVCRRWEGK